MASGNIRHGAIPLSAIVTTLTVSVLLGSAHREESAWGYIYGRASKRGLGWPVVGAQLVTTAFLLHRPRP